MANNIVQITSNNSINVTTQTSNDTVSVITVGPQGPTGPQGEPGDGFPFDGGIAQVTGSLEVTGSSIITGSLDVSGGITGSLLGTSSWAINSLTASYALNASNIDTSNLVTTTSFNNFTSSYNTGSFSGSFSGSLFGTSSWATRALTASLAPNYVPLSQTSSFAKLASINQFTNTNQFDGDVTFLSDIIVGDIAADNHLVYNIGGEITPGRDYWFATASIGKIRTFQNSIEFYNESNKTLQAVLSVDDNSFVIKNNAGAKTAISGANANFTNTVQAGTFIGPLTGTSSWASNSITASNARTASFVNTLNQDVIISGTLTAYTGSFNTINADVLKVTYISSSVVYSSGSNIFGSSSANTQTLIGSVIITGSIFATQSSISKVDYVDFTTTSTPSFVEGRIHWLDDTKTLNIDTDITDVSIEIGHQNIARVRNDSGAPILKGRVVYMSGSQGNRPLIYTSSWESDAVSAGTLGLVAADINNNGTGYVITSGLIRNIDTSAYPTGTLLYLSSSGQFTSTSPTAPLHTVRLGKIINQHASVGIIYVDIDNGYEIGELHDVADNSTSTSYGDLLIKSGSIWNSSKQLTGSYGLTGSLSATSLTGSLQGTASWANNSITASYILNAISSSFATTASYVLTAQTASYVLNAISSSFTSTASLANRNLLTASVSSNVLTFTKGDGSSFELTINTGSGGGGGGGGSNLGSIFITLYDGGANLTTGKKDTPVYVPYNGTCTGWEMLAYNSSNNLMTASCVVDVLSGSFSALPISTASSIAGTQKPTLTNRSSSFSSSLSTWAGLTAGSYIQAEIESVSTGVAKITVAIKVTKS